MTGKLKLLAQLRPKTRVAIALLAMFAASASNAYYVVVDDVDALPPRPLQAASPDYPGAPAMDRTLTGLSASRVATPPEAQFAIYFPKGVTPVTPVSRETLDRVFAKLGNDAKIRIVGRPDAMFVTGGDASLISRKRAVNLRSYFARKGVNMNNITLEVDNDPNPSLDGNLYPSYVYVSDPNDQTPTTNVKDYSAGPAEARYQVRGTPNYEVETIIESPSRRVSPIQPVQPSSNLNRDKLLAFINTGVQTGQLSAAVAVQLIRSMLITDAEPARLPSAPTEQVQRLDAVAAPPRAWTLDKQVTLRENIDNWSRIAGWSPSQWEASNYYQISTTTTVKGEFPEVLRRVAEATGLNICAKPRQRVVRVTNSDTSCQ